MATLHEMDTAVRSNKQLVARRQSIPSQEGTKPHVDHCLQDVDMQRNTPPPTSAERDPPASQTHNMNRLLTEDEFNRYSRQMIVPGMGREGQLRLVHSSMLIIGAGGLGCPAAQYLAGAGVGTIGIVDGDLVEISNLHRQVGHAISRIGMNKVDSLITHLQGLNPLPEYVPYPSALDARNAAKIISGYDLVLDCTDNAATRYLISDVCVLLGKPLVSAAAVQKSGQLIVLNCPPAPQGVLDLPSAPCYRCCFKKPPATGSLATCGELGIMGPVVGMMGVMQAGEALKIIASQLHKPRVHCNGFAENNAPSLLVYSYDLQEGLGPYSFRAVRMGARRKNCFACGVGSTLTLEGIEAGEPNYERFCSVPTSRPSLPDQERISAAAYEEVRRNGRPHLLLDVREKEHFSFGSIDGAVNMPFGSFLMNATRIEKEEGSPEQILPVAIEREGPIFVVCRTGIDSQEVIEKLKHLGLGLEGKRKMVNIVGGMKSWKEEVDPTFPYI